MGFGIPLPPPRPTTDRGRKGGGSLKPFERLYKPPMNTYVVSSCLRASLRFPYAIHVLAYPAVSEHVKLTHRLRVGVLSVSLKNCLRGLLVSCSRQNCSRSHGRL